MHSKKREKFICREDYPVVQTTAGKVRGYVWNDMVIFKGIPYARARRFQKPESPEHWEGVRNVQSYGMVCPLLSKERPNGELFAPHMYWPEDENCQ